MASTYTTNLGIEKPATGEQSGTWGTTVNTNMDIIETAISGQLSLTLAAAGNSGSPNNLPVTDGAISNGQNAFIEVVDGGDLGADAYIQLTPNDAERLIWIKNSLSASRSLYVFQGTYNASNDYVIANGDSALLKFNGAGTGATVQSVASPVTSIVGITGTKSEFDTACTDGNFVYTDTAALTNVTSLGTLTTLTVDNITINGAVITSDTGTIGFDNENLTTTGSVTGATLAGTLSTAAQTNVTSLGTLTALQVDNLNINGNTISATTGAVNITPTAGSAIVLDGTINVDAGVVTGATSITSTNLTGTLQTAAQGNITSLGTLSALQVDNLNINGNTISATTGAVNITPLAGSAIVLDGTINVDAGVVTGATSITSTTFVGALTGNASTATTAGTVTTAAQPNITSLGTLTTLTVDNITVNAAAITSDTGAISFDNENLSTSGTLASGALTVTGAITATGDITAFYTSDMALKQNIEPITSALDKVSRLNGSRFQYKKKEGTFYGLMAQDMQEVLPELVHENADGELTIRMAGFELVALLVEAVKELKGKLDDYTSQRSD